jgi:hypothetical protein
MQLLEHKRAFFTTPFPVVEILEKILILPCLSFPLRPSREFLNLPKNRQISERSSRLKIPTLRKIKILQIPYLKQLVNEKLMCSDVLQSADPSRGRLYGESFTNCPRFICESRFIIMLL